MTKALPNPPPTLLFAYQRRFISISVVTANGVSFIQGDKEKKGSNTDTEMRCSCKCYDVEGICGVLICGVVVRLKLFTYRS